MGSVKPGGVCADARAATGGGDGGGSCVHAKTLGNALDTAAVDDELNHA